VCGGWEEGEGFVLVRGVEGSGLGMVLDWVGLGWIELSWFGLVFQFGFVVGE
jgi:hypothetical protein